MGSQRRYAEVSRLVDCLDKYAFQDEHETGVIRDLRTGLEPCRERNKEDVSFICSDIQPDLQMQEVTGDLSRKKKP
jgi:hypothetical protein